MFTKEDYANLAAVVSLAKCEGLAQAAWIVVTHDKLVRLASTAVQDADEVTLTPQE